MCNVQKTSNSIGYAYFFANDYPILKKYAEACLTRSALNQYNYYEPDDLINNAYIKCQGQGKYDRQAILKAMSSVIYDCACGPFIVNGLNSESKQILTVNDCKACKECKKEKPLTDFPTQFNKKVGKTYYKPLCKTCTNKYAKSLIKKNGRPSDTNEKRRAYIAKHKEQLSDYYIKKMLARRHSPAYLDEHPEIIQAKRIEIYQRRLKTA